MKEHLEEKMRTAQMWGKNLERLRKEKTLTQRDLAKMTGIPFYTLSRYEVSGLEMINTTNLVLICDALGVTPNDILGY